jgi:hypothetical protein
MRFARLLLIAGLLSGCTTNYAWDVDQRGQVYLKGTRQVFDPQKAAAVVDAVNDTAISTVGAYARGYAASGKRIRRRNRHTCRKLTRERSLDPMVKCPITSPTASVPPSLDRTE